MGRPPPSFRRPSVELDSQSHEERAPGCGEVTDGWGCTEEGSRDLGKGPRDGGPAPGVSPGLRESLILRTASPASRSTRGAKDTVE